MNEKAVTRLEKILNGEDVQPVTRLDYLVKDAVSGGGGAGGVLIVTDDYRTIDGRTAWFLSKTFNEIYNAYVNGTRVIIKYHYSGWEYPYEGQEYSVVFVQNEAPYGVGAINQYETLLWSTQDADGCPYYSGM